MNKKFYRYALSVAVMFGLVACGGGSSGPSRVETAKLGHIDNSRLGGTYEFGAGGYMVATADKLTNTANFSKTGKVKSTITITAVAPAVGGLTPAVLNGFDMFFIGWHAEGSSNALNAAEMTALQNWVNAGGILIATCDDPGHDVVCTAFGYPVIDVANGPTLPSATGANHGIFKGSFGTVTSVIMTGNKNYFADSTGAIVLGIDQPTGNATVMQRDFGAGTVIFMGDVDMITTYGALSAGPNIDPANQNDMFLGNLFEYATGLI